MRWTGHVARVGRGQVYREFWWTTPEETDHLEDQGVDERMIIKWIFKT
jgi:hypothetical protein